MLPSACTSGRSSVLSTPCLAVIGSRKATPYGIAAAPARGDLRGGVRRMRSFRRRHRVRPAAGHAALRAGGVHIAVLGCGADVVYPKSSAALLSRCAESGGAVRLARSLGNPSAALRVPPPQPRDSRAVPCRVHRGGGASIGHVLDGRGGHGLRARGAGRSRIHLVSAFSRVEQAHSRRRMRACRRGVH